MTLRLPVLATLSLISFGCASDPSKAPEETFDAQPAAAVELPAAPRAEWTIMVYMAGDNNLEAAAIGDLNEMEMVGSTDDVNIVVQLDRSTEEFHGQDDWSGSRRYLVTGDDDTRTVTSPVVMDLGDTDSGSAQTLAEFTAWTVQNYPAEHYAVVVWNHGEGWRSGTKSVASDDGTGSSISVAEGELAAAVAATATSIGQPVDLVGFDACLMQTWEVASSLAPSARVLVASQETEPGEGWAYDLFLADVVANPAMSDRDVGTAIVDSYIATQDGTLSVVELNRVAELSAALDDVAGAVLASSDADALMVQAEAAAWSSPVYADYNLFFNRDLGQVLASFAGSADADVATAAADALLVLDEVVLENRVSDDYAGVSGLSVFTGFQYIDQTTLTDDGQSLIADYLTSYANASWAAGNLWDELVLGTPAAL